MAVNQNRTITLGPTSHLNSLKTDLGVYVTLESNLSLHGSLTISGTSTLNATDRTIYLEKDWRNQVGPDGFVETNSRVVFNGNLHLDTTQCIHQGEIFNVLELAKPAGSLIFNSAGAEVSCAQYDWTHGSLQVWAGTFTALDLADDGIYGGIRVQGEGIVNLTNSDGSVNLNGDLIFNGGGTINIHGGTSLSWWPGTGNSASILMTGGILDFKDVGIYIPDGTNFSHDITSGIIRTVGYFTCNNATFTPQGGTIELYGPTDCYLYMYAGTLHHLTVNKSAREADRALVTRLATNVSCTFDLLIAAGVLDLNGFSLSCRNLYIFDTLRMANPADKLMADNFVTWYADAVADVSQGVIELGGNWNVNNGAQVVLPVSVGVYLKSISANSLIYLASGTTQMGNLTIGRDSSGSAYTGGIYTISSESTCDLVVTGDLYISESNELDLNQRSLVMDGELDLHGKLDIHSNTATVHGKCYLNYLSELNVGNGYFLCDNSETPNQIDLTGTISIGTGTCELVHKALLIWSSGLVEMEGGTLICYSIIAVYPNTIQPASGTVIFPERHVSGGASGIFVTSGNWLPNLTINAGDDWFFLKADLTIKGDFNFISGYLTATDLSTEEDRNIQIEGDWNNQGGNFLPQTGRVTFNGSFDQYITANASYNILEVDKPITAVLEISPGVTVTCDSYDWTSGNLRTNASVFTATDLADNGIFGRYMVQDGGTLNLSNHDGRIDLNCDLFIYSGTVNVYGGTHYSTWPYAANAILQLSELGTLNFHDQGIYIYNSATYSFIYNIFGGTITTTGDLLCSRPGFSPGAGTFEFLGASNNSVNFTAANCGLFNLTLNKPSSNHLLLNNGLACAGNVSLASGELKLNGQTLGCGGSLTVGETAILDLAQNSRLEMAGNISAASGALIRSLGSVSLPCRVTRQGTGYYGFTLNSGATLHAQHTIFEYCSANGLFVRNGSTVTSLDNCTFQNGISQGNLLTIGNTQDLTILNAVFPDNTWDGAHNVRKVIDAGTVYIQGFSGDFAGAAFEDDEFNRLFWTGGDPDLRIFQVLWSDTGPYLCDPLTATVSVFNNSAYDVTEPFRVDLYYHSGTVPPPGAPGDRFLDFPCLSGGETKTAQINNISSDEAVTWHSWVVVDAAGQIAESNENNNVWSLPIITQWQPLPLAYDLSIVPHPTLPGQVYITWEYDLSVFQYKIYKDSDPYGSFSTLAGTAGSKRFAEPASNTKTFYRVTAERVLP